jgi:hypothetical protein
MPRILYAALIALMTASFAFAGCKAPKKDNDPNEGRNPVVEVEGGIETVKDTPTAEERKSAVLDEVFRKNPEWQTAAGTITWRTRMDQAWRAAERQQLNVLVFFHDPQAKESRAVESIFRNSADLIDLSSYYYCVKVDVTKPANKEEVEYYRGTPAPQLVVYNPGRAKLWRSSERAIEWTEEDIAKVMKTYRRRQERRKGS